MKKSGSSEKQSASELIDKRIAGLVDWRGETLSSMRNLIQDADPDVVEEVKWRKPSNSMLGVPSRPRPQPKVAASSLRADQEGLDRFTSRGPPASESSRPATNLRPTDPVWSHDGIICTGEIYKDKVKLTFAKGASPRDTSELFNASLDGNTRRAIDIHEGEKVDARAFKALVRAAVDLNSALGKGKPKRAK